MTWADGFAALKCSYGHLLELLLSETKNSEFALLEVLLQNTTCDGRIALVISSNTLLFFFSLLNFPPNLLLTAYICLFHTAWFSKYVSQANAEGVIFFPQRLGVKCDILSHTL